MKTQNSKNQIANSTYASMDAAPYEPPRETSGVLFITPEMAEAMRAGQAASRIPAIKRKRAKIRAKYLSALAAIEDVLPRNEYHRRKYWIEEKCKKRMIWQGLSEQQRIDKLEKFIAAHSVDGEE